MEPCYILLQKTGAAIVAVEMRQVFVISWSISKYGTYTIFKGCTLAFQGVFSRVQWPLFQTHLVWMSHALYATPNIINEPVVSVQNVLRGTSEAWDLQKPNLVSNQAREGVLCDGTALGGCY